MHDRTNMDRTMTWSQPRRLMWLFRIALVVCMDLRQYGFLRTPSILVAKIGVWFVEKASSFLIWWFSPRVEDEVFEDRESRCNRCEKQETTTEGKRYCGACGCPKWKYAELKIKNRFAGHNCPLGYHPGSRPLPEPKPQTQVAAKPPCNSPGCNGQQKTPEQIIAEYTAALERAERDSDMRTGMVTAESSI